MEDDVSECRFDFNHFLQPSNRRGEEPAIVIMAQKLYTQPLNLFSDQSPVIIIPLKGEGGGEERVQEGTGFFDSIQTLFLLRNNELGEPFNKEGDAPPSSYSIE